MNPLVRTLTHFYAIILTANVLFFIRKFWNLKYSKTSKKSIKAQNYQVFWVIRCYLEKLNISKSLKNFKVEVSFSFFRPKIHVFNFHPKKCDSRILLVWNAWDGSIQNYKECSYVPLTYLGYLDLYEIYSLDITGHK